MASVRLRRWTVALQPGDALEFVSADWRDALVLVAHGELNVECLSGRCATFPAGAVLTLAGLRVHRLSNRGSTSLILCALTRVQHAAEDRPTTD